jgi:hypothetical protein
VDEELDVLVGRGDTDLDRAAGSVAADERREIVELMVASGQRRLSHRRATCGHAQLV